MGRSNEPALVCLLLFLSKAAWLFVLGGMCFLDFSTLNYCCFLPEAELFRYSGQIYWKYIMRFQIPAHIGFQNSKEKGFKELIPRDFVLERIKLNY